jgi:hypothetical protein
VAALDLLKTQTENEPQSSQSKRQKPKITSQAHQTTVLRSLQVHITLTVPVVEHVSVKVSGFHAIADHKQKQTDKTKKEWFRYAQNGGKTTRLHG